MNNIRNFALNNRIEVGDLVRFINADFLLGVVTKISVTNNYVTVLGSDGYSEMYLLNTICKYSSNINLKSDLEHIFNLLKEVP